MEEEIEAKKELLQKEILDKNYDQNKFIEFCTSKKENGDDLTQWTLEELQEIVKEFIKTQEETSENTNKNVEEKTNSEEKKEGENIEDDINNMQ